MWPVSDCPGRRDLRGAVRSTIEARKVSSPPVSINGGIWSWPSLIRTARAVPCRCEEERRRHDRIRPYAETWHQGMLATRHR